MVQRHHIKTYICLGQFHRLHGSYGTSDEVVSCDGNQLLSTTGTTGEQDNGNIVPRIWGMVVCTRSIVCRDHLESHVFKLLNTKHWPATVIQLQLANVSVQRDNSISLRVFYIRLQLLWHRVRCHRHNGVPVDESKNSNCHERAVRQDDSDARLSMVGESHGNLETLQELPDGNMCQMPSGISIDETGTGVCPY